jgi:hypothetical protein
MARLFSLEMNPLRRAIIRGIPKRVVFQYPDCKASLYQDRKIPSGELSPLNSGRKSFLRPFKGECLKK